MDMSNLDMTNMMDYRYWVVLTLANFALAMFLLAVIFVLLHRLIVGRRVAESEIVYRWMSFFALGLTCIYTFFVHAFFPGYSASAIGWPNSPFQYEVAIADLAFGVIAILSFRSSYGFRLATVIGSTIWLWGDAIGHIYQIMIHRNYSIGNAGSWLWMDIIVPLILIICIVKLRPGKLIVA